MTGSSARGIRVLHERDLLVASATDLDANVFGVLQNR